MVHFEPVCHISDTFAAMLVHIGQNTHFMTSFDHTLCQLVTMCFNTTYFWGDEIRGEKYAIFGITLKYLTQTSLFIN